MRTTVDINEDLLKQLRRRADEQGLPFREVLTQVIRRGLAATTKPKVEPFVMPTHSFGGFNIDVTKALSIAFELEDEAMIRKMTLGQ